MTALMEKPRVSRRDLLKAGGVMVVAFSSFGDFDAIAAPAARSLKTDALDSWIAISRDNIVTIYSGRIDMGTGIATGYMQIVADELYFPVERIRLVMGDTATTPNQGKTTASNGLNIGAQPIRLAAAQARTALIQLAGRKHRISRPRTVPSMRKARRRRAFPTARLSAIKVSISRSRRRSRIRPGGRSWWGKPH